MTKDLVFIASGGRTGTTYFGNTLKTVIEDCWSEHEPDVFASKAELTLPRLRAFGLWHMVVGRILGVAGLRPLGHRLLAGRISEAACVAALKRQRRAYHESIAEPLVIESSGRWWMFAGMINEIWPDAKMIGVIRDPRDWIVSWRRHQPRRHTPNWIGWFPLGPLTPRDVGDADWIARWDALDPFGRLAWDWRYLTGVLTDAAKANPNIRVFRFEDVFADPAAMEDLIAFAASHKGRDYAFALPAGLQKKVYNASRGAPSDWRDWPDEQARLVDDLCGDLMRAYGYGDEPEWLEKLARTAPVAEPVREAAPLRARAS